MLVKGAIGVQLWRDILYCNIPLDILDTLPSIPTSPSLFETRHFPQQISKLAEVTPAVVSFSEEAN